MKTVGLVPCAGKGSRLGLPFSKEMFPIIHNDEYTPIITYTIQAMKKAGIKHIIFTINPQKGDLLRYLGNGEQFGMKFTYCIHPVPRSLPESLYEAIHLIQDKNVVFAMPDTFVQPTDYLETLLKDHFSEQDRAVTLACFQTNNPSKFGMVDYKENRVSEIIDKPLNSQLNWMWGAMVWGPEFTIELKNFVENADNHNNKAEELIFSDALNTLIPINKVYCFRFSNGIYKDLGTYKEIIEWIKSL